MASLPPVWGEAKATKLEGRCRSHDRPRHPSLDLAQDVRCRLIEIILLRQLAIQFDQQGGKGSVIHYQAPGYRPGDQMPRDAPTWQEHVRYLFLSSPGSMVGSRVSDQRL